MRLYMPRGMKWLSRRGLDIKQSLQIPTGIYSKINHAFVIDRYAIKFGPAVSQKEQETKWGPHLKGRPRSSCTLSLILLRLYCRHF